MNLEKQKAFLIHFAYIALIVGIAYISIKYFLPLLMPFVIGLIVAALLRHVIDRISEKLHLRRSIVSILLLIIFYSIIALLAIWLSGRVFSFLMAIFNQLPAIYSESIAPALQKASDNLLNRFPGIEPYTQDILDNISQSMMSFITKASTAVVGTITGFAARVPSILINFLFTIVSSFFFTIDYYKISNFVLRQFKKEKRDMILLLKSNVVGTLGKFIKAYLTLITITFTELSIGLFLLGIPNPLLVAGLIAFVDLMPILGTGAVLLPWTIISFLFGKTSMGVGILILYIVVTIVRQTLEPKIVGQQIGLHPVVTLLCIFAGAQLLGVAGLFMFPITATILKKMNDEGTIHLFK